jgi:acetyltransferase-like isoleucine patch superfamily enzyme
MKKLIRRIQKKIFSKSYKSQSDMDLFKSNNSIFKQGENCKIKNCKIVLESNSTLILLDNVTIEGYEISLTDGVMEIGNNCFLLQGAQYFRPKISISSGRVFIGNNNVVRATISIRFGGVFKIGEYNAINEETEIRCDESIRIGDFNMVSYQCMIYDTNTHNQYPADIRRKMTKHGFPNIGAEVEKPLTKPVTIGNDNWFGKRSTILKGCEIGNEVTVGTGAVVSNIQLNKGVLVGNPAFILDKK